MKKAAGFEGLANEKDLYGKPGSTFS